jgi:biopolymer transport protein ExbD
MAATLPLVDPDLEPLEEGEDHGPLLPRRRPQLNAEMDITPMIDVTFLLLIFFLVSSIADPSLAIDLPAAEFGDGVDSRTTAPVTLVANDMPDAPLVYRAEGRDEAALLPADEATQMAELEGYFSQALSEGKTAALILAEREVRYRHIARIVRLAGSLGMTVHVGVMEAH